MPTHPRTRRAPGRSWTTRLRARAALVATVALAGTLVGPGAVADDDDPSRDELVERLADNEERREELEHDLEGVSAELSTTLVDLQLTREQIPVAQEALRVAEEDLAAADRHQEQVEGRLGVAESDLADLEAEIADGEAASEETQDALGELARSTYRGDTAPSTLALITEASSAEDFIGSYSVVSTAVRTQTGLLDRVAEENATNRNQRLRQDTLTQRVDDLNDEAVEAVAAADELRGQQEAALAEVEDLEALQADLVEELEGREEDLNAEINAIGRSSLTTQQQIAAIDEENRRLERERLEREQREREAAEEARREREAQERADRIAREQAEMEANPVAPPPAAPAPTPTPPPAPSPEPPPAPSPEPPPESSATFIPPVPRPLVITSPYGPRIYPITGAWSIHPGVDFRSACGNTQVAIAGGTVSATNPSGATGTSGNQVIINHGIVDGRSTVSIYNHLSSFAVSPGQSVSQGQAIGSTGQTGMVTGCHVHLELWLDGQMTDPMNVL
ncbi:peptidoglycan DD-metalloendopeptidase family protein [Georgenia sp. Z1491]|uniref:peptidoglycan DD-metalloendopeptidase family protein n=1 Tax=Georgenia sp. Z1491 TaxID=3416707 RepID=UPI003CFB9531